MRKTILLFIALVVPLSAWAMSPLSETDLSLVTGRSGVSFFVDVTMNIHIDTLAWGDSDGLAPGPYNPWGVETSGGYVGISGLTVKGLSVNHYPAGVSCGYVVSPNSVSFWPEASTIDVCNGAFYFRVPAGPGSR